MFVGAGGLSKHACYRAARDWGVRVCLVCADTDEIPDDLYDELLRVEGLHSHRDDPSRAHEIGHELRQRGIQPDGVTTLWEDCGPLATALARLLGLPGNDPLAATVAKSKLATYQRLSGSERLAAQRLAPAVWPCRSVSELDRALSEVGFPALIKLEHGSSAAAVIPIKTAREAFRVWRQISATLKGEDDFPGIGLGFNNHLIVTPLLSGTEHDVDIVLANGTICAAFVTDNGITRQPSFAETAAVMPSTLDSGLCEGFVEAAHNACLAVGLTSGVFNVEILNTSSGPIVIDLNGRMGGFYIRDWIRRLWNYDLLQAVLLCSVGEDPPPATTSTEGSIVGVMLSPAAHGTWLEDGGNVAFLRELAQANQDVVLSRFEADVHAHPFVDDPWGNLAVFHPSPLEAAGLLIELWGKLGLDRVDPTIINHIPLHLESST